MKKRILLFIIFILVAGIFSFPAFSDFDSSKSLLVYFISNHNEFTLLEVTYMMNELKNYFATQGIIVYDLGITNDDFANKIFKRDNFKVYIEFSGNITSISGNYGNYDASANVIMKLENPFDNEEPYVDSLEDYGSKMPNISDAKALALSITSINLVTKNIEKIKQLLNEK